MPPILCIALCVAMQLFCSWFLFIVWSHIRSKAKSVQYFPYCMQVCCICPQSVLYLPKCAVFAPKVCCIWPSVLYLSQKCVVFDLWCLAIQTVKTQNYKSVDIKIHFFPVVGILFGPTIPTYFFNLFCCFLYLYTSVTLRHANLTGDMVCETAMPPSTSNWKFWMKSCIS